MYSIHKLFVTSISNPIFNKLRKLNPYKIVVFTGIVFLFGSVLDLYYDISIKKVLLMIRQITWQSNLYAFLLALLYLLKPNLLIFYSNYLFIIVASLLITSSIIFFFALLPIFLNLNLISQSALIPATSLIFWNIWNHAITPIAFFRLLLHRLSEQSSKWIISRRVAWFRYKIYWLIQIFSNIFFSFDPNQLSAYGAFSNWYWGKKTFIQDSEGNLNQSLVISYNFQLAFFAFFIVMFVACSSFFLLWYFFEPKYQRNHKILLPLNITPFT